MKRDLLILGVILVMGGAAFLVGREPDYTGLYRRGTEAWNAGRYAEAEREVTRCQEGPRRPHMRRESAARSAYDLARLLWEHGRPSEALAFASESVQGFDRSEPDLRSAALFLRGLVLRDLKDWRAAERDFRETVTLRESRVPVDAAALDRARRELAAATAAQARVGDSAALDDE